MTLLFRLRIEVYLDEPVQTPLYDQAAETPAPAEPEPATRELGIEATQEYQPFPHEEPIKPASVEEIPVGYPRSDEVADARMAKERSLWRHETP